MGLLENLYSISSIKEEIKTAIESKGVDMTGLSFADYPGAISSIQTGGNYSQLYVTENGTYYPDGSEEDAFDEVVVDVPTGYTEKDVTEGNINIVNLSNSASFVAEGVFAYKNTQTIDLSLCQYVGSNAFNGCYNLNNISLPVCESIYSGAFQSCSSLSQVYLPECTTIHVSAFKYCATLLNVDLPECERIGAAAFAECVSLSYVSLPACRRIDQSGFQGAFQLADVSSVNIVLPVCSYIGANAFYWTKKLSTITLLSDSVCSNGGNTFNNAGLTAIYVPASLVDAYKVATNWGTYANIIFPIPE